MPILAGILTASRDNQNLRALRGLRVRSRGFSAVCTGLHSFALITVIDSQPTNAYVSKGWALEEALFCQPRNPQIINRENALKSERGDRR